MLKLPMMGKRHIAGRADATVGGAGRPYHTGLRRPPDFVRMPAFRGGRRA
jgi:ribosomal protein L4